MVSAMTLVMAMMMATAMVMAMVTVTVTTRVKVMATATATEMATAMVIESNNTEIVIWGQVAATTAIEWHELVNVKIYHFFMCSPIT